MSRSAFSSAAPRAWQIVLALGAAIVFQMVLAQSMLTGIATPREPVVLPPEASLEVVLIDVSRADAPAETIGRTVVDRLGAPPWRFTIPFDPARIVPNHRYAVRATVRSAGALILTTDTVHPVLTHGAPTSVSLPLRAVGRTTSGAGAADGTGAGATGGTGAPSSPAQALGTLPASYVGVLPCADCPGIVYHLDLFADQAYTLRLTYQDRPAPPLDDIGAWTVSSDGTTLVLRGGREAPVRLAIKDARTLTRLDLEGRPIVSAANHDLVRTATFEPVEPRVLMRGTYRYFADAGLFTECLTGRRMPVAQEADNAALEAAYGRARREPAEELVVSVEGRIAQRPPMEGPGPRATLVVDRFVGVWPGETCGNRFVDAPLENTYWKLTRLGSDPVIVAPRQREPHIVLRRDGRTVSGHGGCNPLVGEYRTEGSRISFGKVAMTARACVDGMNVETRLAGALERAVRWNVLGDHLELYDAAGNLLARFESRLMS